MRVFCAKLISDNCRFVISDLRNPVKTPKITILLNQSSVIAVISFSKSSTEKTSAVAQAPGKVSAVQTDLMR